MPRLMWWDKKQGSGVRIVRDLAAKDPLVTSFGDGMVVVAMEVKDDHYLASWTVAIGPRHTLPEVEEFVAKVASFIIDEPVDD